MTKIAIDARGKIARVHRKWAEERAIELELQAKAQREAQAERARRESEAEIVRLLLQRDLSSAPKTQEREDADTQPAPPEMSEEEVNARVGLSVAAGLDHMHKQNQRKK